MMASRIGSGFGSREWLVVAALALVIGIRVPAQEWAGRDLWPQRVQEAIRDGDRDRAVSAARRIVSSGRNDGAALAIAATGLAFGDEGNEAIDVMIRAVRNGYSDVRLIESHAHYTALRAYPRYAEVEAVLMPEVERRLRAIDAALPGHEPIVLAPRGHDAAAPATLVIALHPNGSTGRAYSRAWRPVVRRLGALVVCPDALRPAASDGFEWGYEDEVERIVLATIEHVEATHAIETVIVVGSHDSGRAALRVARGQRERIDGVVAIGTVFPPFVDALRDDREWPTLAVIQKERRAGAVSDPSLDGLPDTVRRRRSFRLFTVTRIDGALPTGAEGMQVVRDAIEWCVERTAPESSRAPLRDPRSRH